MASIRAAKAGELWEKRLRNSQTSVIIPLSDDHTMEVVLMGDNHENRPGEERNTTRDCYGGEVRKTAEDEEAHGHRMGARPDRTESGRQAWSQPKDEFGDHDLHDCEWGYGD